LDVNGHVVPPRWPPQLLSVLAVPAAAAGGGCCRCCCCRGGFAWRVGATAWRRWRPIASDAMFSDAAEVLDAMVVRRAGGSTCSAAANALLSLLAGEDQWDRLPSSGSGNWRGGNLHRSEGSRRVRRRRLRLISAAIVVLAVAGLAGSAAEMKRAPAATAGVQWAACPAPSPGRDPRQQCATVEVPLDYRNPRGRSIQIAVSRIPAKSGSRRGVMMTNPGGPGVPGVELPSLLQGLFPPGVLDQYDVMGMDPRGVGQSSPISCGSSDDAPLDLLLPYPAPNGSIARNIDFAELVKCSV
jgi:hypothetical protein